MTQRGNPPLRQSEKYSQVKETVARLFPNSIDQYMAYKSPCIDELYMECGLK
jgi:GrpB-like predicted nucleotidyltransferase (UPF0157 family)